MTAPATPELPGADSGGEDASSKTKYASSKVGSNRKRITLDLDPALLEELNACVAYAKHHGFPKTTKVETWHRALDMALTAWADHFNVDRDEGWPEPDQQPDLPF